MKNSLITMLMQRGKVPALFTGTIVDVETTGLSPRFDRLITVGILCNGEYEIYQATDGSSLPDVLGSVLHNLPRPIYAFNKSFEEGFLGIRIDRELQLRPFEGKNEAIRISGVEDPLGHGSRIPPEWASYLADGGRDHLERIVAHNFADLQSELCLAIVRSWDDRKGTFTI